jgi:hypothetical protein
MGASADVGFSRFSANRGYKWAKLIGNSSGSSKPSLPGLDLVTQRMNRHGVQEASGTMKRKGSTSIPQLSALKNLNSVTPCEA